MASFGPEEYADILFVYGFCNGNRAAARRKYRRRFPNRRVPHVGVFADTYRRLRETGSTQGWQHDAGRPPVNLVEDEEEILQRFHEDPTTSTRILASRLGISQWKVWFTMHTAQMHPYHYTPVHALEEGDPVRRMEFCRFFINADMEEKNFLNKILWTDESKFDRDGITNYHNSHYWVPKGQNPRQKKEKAHQRRFSFNVWMGLIDSYLIGPFFCHRI